MANPPLITDGLNTPPVAGPFSYLTAIEEAVLAAAQSNATRVILPSPVAVKLASGGGSDIPVVQAGMIPPVIPPLWLADP